MKNFTKAIGIIALVTVIGFSFVSCKGVSLEGTTWNESDGVDDVILKFDSPPNMTMIDGRNPTRGTYTVSGSKVTVSIEGEKMTGTVSGNTLTFKGDEFTAEFTKQ